VGNVDIHALLLAIEIISAITAAIAAYIAHRSARDATRLASRAMSLASRATEIASKSRASARAKAAEFSEASTEASNASTASRYEEVGSQCFPSAISRFIPSEPRAISRDLSSGGMVASMDSPNAEFSGKRSESAGT